MPKTRGGGGSVVSSAHSTRVVINTSRASSSNPSSYLELTTPPMDRSGFSFGSTAPGDSFVAVDFFDSFFDDDDDRDESFVDPYLLCQCKTGRREDDDDETEQHRQHHLFENSIDELDFFIPRRAKEEKNNDNNNTKTQTTPETATWETSFEASFPDLDSSFFSTPPNRHEKKATSDDRPPRKLSLPPQKLFRETDQVSIDNESEQSSLATAEYARIQRERIYWKDIVEQRMKKLGSLSVRTAQAYMELGFANESAREYVEAQAAFQSACQIFRNCSKPLAVALAMERMAVASRHCAAVKDDPVVSLRRAYTLLLEAFRIRQTELGSWHVDTVDCMNKIAKLHVQANNLLEARRCYWQVFFLRRAIFGVDHPSCAVAAHDLANLFFRMGSKEDADNFYHIAMEIYDKMDLPIENPAVARLLRDMKRLQRIQSI